MYLARLRVVNPRERWQTLQSHLSEARGALAKRDKTTALEHIEAALAIDPEFLAARMLRDRVMSPEPESRITPPPQPPVPDILPSADAQRVASTAPVLSLSSETLANFEERVKERVRLREAAAAEAALASRHRRHLTARLAAAAVFLTAISGADIYDPSILPSRSLAMSTRLVQVVAPQSPYDGDAVEQPVLPSQPFARPAPTSVAVTAMVDAPPEPVRQPLPRSSTQALQNVPPSPQISSQPAPLVPSTQSAPSQAATPSPAAAPPAAPANSRPVQALPPRPMPDTTVAANVVPTSPAVVPALLVSSVDDRALVDQALQRYRRAYNRLDARSAQAIYPAVNASALAHAFGSLESQVLSFDSCDFDVQVRIAAVTCRGTSRYVPKIGNHVPRVEPRVWNFTLRKDDGDWKIAAARAGLQRPSE